MQTSIGQIAALGTSVCWTVTALAFEYAAKKIGSLALNILRLTVAFGIFAGVGLVLHGQLIPLNAPGSVWFWLTLSGLVGFVFGDIFLFQSYIDIGARTAQVIFVSSPLITAILGFFLLGERIAPLGIFGMVLVIASIITVILYKNAITAASGTGDMDPGIHRTHKIRGAIFALLGALGQSGGLILSKIGAPSYDPLGATQIRVIAGLLGFIIVGALWKRLREPIAALSNRNALAALSLGAFFGPFLGVSLGLFAVQRSSSGIAATLMGLTPILILLPSVFIYKEKITPVEGLGALVAVLGAALIFYTP
jgi:drug/metabolite transporter (DMT)-like permease